MKVVRTKGYWKQWLMAVVVLSMSLGLHSAFAQNQDGGAAQQTASTNNHKIIFVNLEFKQPKGAKDMEVALVSTKVVDGKLKNYKQHDPYQEPGKLLCTILDKENQTIQQLVIDDPLHPTYEYHAEDGSLKHITVAKEQDQYSLRLQLEASFYAVRIERIMEDFSTETIKTLTLNL